MGLRVLEGAHTVVYFVCLFVCFTLSAYSATIVS